MLLREYDEAIRAESGGRLGFKIYAGGVQGEDKDVIEKIRLGQLQSAGVHGRGCGRDRPEGSGSWIRRFSSRTTTRSIMCTARLTAEFDEAFRDNGFVLLGWAEVGFVYVFSNTPVRGPWPT